MFITVQHAATHCSTLQHAAPYYHTIPYDADYTRAIALWGWERGEGITRSYSHSPRCNTLQHTATHCNTLQHIATRCRLHKSNHFVGVRAWRGHTPVRAHIHHTATRCNTLQQTATHCNTDNTLHHVVSHCNTLQHAATRCNTLQHDADYTRAITLWGGGRGEGINPFVLTFRANSLARTGKYEPALVDYQAAEKLFLKVCVLCVCVRVYMCMYICVYMYVTSTYTNYS